METLDSLVENFESTAATETQEEAGWMSKVFKYKDLVFERNCINYCVSKIAFGALTRILQRMMKEDPREDIVVNHVHPGFVATDMTQGVTMDLVTIDKGAQAPVFAAMLPPKTEIQGAYIWHDCTLVDWVDGEIPDFP